MQYILYIKEGRKKNLNNIVIIFWFEIFLKNLPDTQFLRRQSVPFYGLVSYVKPNLLIFRVNI